jgi:mono/diheme cytochrome c family protein
MAFAKRAKRRALVAALVPCGLVLVAVVVPAPALGGDPLPINSTLEDFFLPGTQPDPTGSEILPLPHSQDCTLCHADFELSEPPLPKDAEPWRNWKGSLMAHSARDPVFWAALTIANQDADFGGDICLRCHTPAGWLAGRSDPPDGSALIHASVDPNKADFDGVTCEACHRMVNPVYVPGESPAVDETILDDLEVLGLLPPQPHTGQYVIDPEDRRRGPYDLGKGFFFHFWEQSPFHQDSELCATCHDVSNPLFERQGDTFVLDPKQLDMPHTTGDKYDMVPVERTYSEWLVSDFAAGGVDMMGRFGGAHPTGIMESCQDCHMPDQVSPGCRVPGFAPHLDLGAHFLNGGNTWVINAVQTLYNDGDMGLHDPVFMDEPTGLTQEIIDDAIARSIQFLQDASDMELTQEGNYLRVRITNYCGHKLPTGYPEGRRIWLNVKFLDDQQEVIYEHGTYDFGTAELTSQDTKVYEMQAGMDAAIADLTGLPEGKSFHFLLSNTILYDNRIPPIGFTNAAAEAVQTQPVGYTYADGQHWDDTLYLIPCGTVSAMATLYYQSTSKEYIEFLRDTNATDNRGQIAYDQWELHGKSAPVNMDTGMIKVITPIPGDLTGDGVVSTADLLQLLADWGPCPKPCPPWCLSDIDKNCTVATGDLLILLGNWG